MATETTTLSSRRSARLSVLALLLPLALAQPSLGQIPAGTQGASSPSVTTSSSATAPAPTPGRQATAQPTAAASAVPGLTVTLEPVSTTIDYERDEATLKVRLRNLASSSRTFSVEASRLLLKADGAVVGKASLPDFGGGDSADVTIKGGDSLPIGLQVTALRNTGTYEGTVRVRSMVDAERGTETVLPLLVIRQSSGFDPRFAGEGLANNVLTMKPKTQDDTKFSFTVEIPREASNSKVKVGVAARFSGELAMDVRPLELTLLPGAPPQTVEIELKNLPKSGDYSGRLSFSDGTMSKELVLIVQPSFVPAMDWVYLAAIVLAGALTSALVGAALPLVTRRGRLTRRLRDLRDRVNAFPPSEMYAKSALARNVYKAYGQSHEVWWFVPSSSSLLDELATRTSELEALVEFVSELVELRSKVNTSPDIPSSSIVALCAELDAVAKALVKTGVTAARTRLDRALESIEASRNSLALRGALDISVQSLPNPPVFPKPIEAPEELDGPEEQGETTEPPAVVGRRLMLQRLAKLRLDYKALPAAPSVELLLRLDHECQCLKLYFERYLDMVRNRPNAATTLLGAEMDIIDALGRGRRGVLDAAAQLDSLEMGVSKAEVDDALAKLKESAQVTVSPENPQGSELITFRLLFHNAALNDSPLLWRVPVLWSFAAGAPEALGTKVGNFFRGQDLSSFKTTGISYSVCVGPALEQKIEGKLLLPSRLRSWANKSSFSVGAEFSAFVLTLGLATMLALVSKFGETGPLDSLQDYLNPFLWGFGADRAKALVNTNTGAGTSATNAGLTPAAPLS